MGCRCCRMITSYIYDPTAAVDVRKADSADSSLYQPHAYPGGASSSDQLSGHNEQKQGFHNLGYNKSNDSTLKLEADNNQVNHRLHRPTLANELHRQSSAPPAEGELYIIQPEVVGPRWVIHDTGPSQVPVYPNIQEYENQRNYGKQGHQTTRDGFDGSIAEISSKSQSTDEIDEGVVATPEYPCDTGDESSVLSVDIHTSTTSLSSADTRDELTLPKTPDASTEESGISVTKSEDEEEDAGNQEEEVQSVTDSMVAEALAALEAATAGEDFE
ncbi:uncharacterized protein zgc:194930 [Acanthochromis polyacanthus]|uniref:Uncharacterized LOC110962997 n=1 Tax=Acanthochromis polyacanthus TaxID=80966 RepID=A0A3Q1EAI4_9TELE|nr:uncharacterized protein zgc:194930 [Acanthochromis polyacanthus]